MCSGVFTNTGWDLKRPLHPAELVLDLREAVVLVYYLLVGRVQLRTGNSPPRTAI